MSEYECPICFKDIGVNNYFITKCNHRFCGTCIIKNLNISSLCPLCREPLSDSSHDIFDNNAQFSYISELIQNYDIKTIARNFYNIINDNVNFHSVQYNTIIFLPMWTNISETIKKTLEQSIFHNLSHFGFKLFEKINGHTNINNNISISRTISLSDIEYSINENNEVIVGGTPPTIINREMERDYLFNLYNSDMTLRQLHDTQHIL